MRLWRALGVWWGGIGLFLDGYVLVPTVHPARKPGPVSESPSQNKAGLRLRLARVSFIAIDAAAQRRCSFFADAREDSHHTAGAQQKKLSESIPKKKTVHDVRLLTNGQH